MYNLPYVYAYALPDMRRIALVLMHILIQSQSSYKSIFSYKTSNDAETSDDAETHMQHEMEGKYRVTNGDVNELLTFHSAFTQAKLSHLTTNTVTSSYSYHLPQLDIWSLTSAPSPPPAMRSFSRE
jgi:hypothetical protein